MSREGLAQCLPPRRHVTGPEQAGHGPALLPQSLPPCILGSPDLQSLQPHLCCCVSVTRPTAPPLTHPPGRADYTGIKAGCGAALPAKCTACPCALLASLGGTLQSLGYDVDFSKVRNISCRSPALCCERARL